MLPVQSALKVHVDPVRTLSFGPYRNVLVSGSNAISDPSKSMVIWNLDDVMSGQQQDSSAVPHEIVEVPLDYGVVDSVSSPWA